MSTFFRGPICGTDNCRSRLWRIIDGRRTCQYGHVMEGDVEFNDDEDDINSMGVVTRRLNLTTNVTGSFRSSMNSQLQNSQKNDEFPKVYGAEADRLFLKCFQHILKLQCEYLISYQKFPRAFRECVKLMWMNLLKDMGKDGITNVSSTKSAQGAAQKSDKLGLSLLSSVTLLYLAGAYLKLPVFWFDFLGWICSMKLLYFQANKHLPELWRRQLPNFYLQVLEGGRAPSNAHFYHKLAHMCSRLDAPSTFGTRIAIEPLLVKLLLRLRLPPHLFFHVVQLVRICEDKSSHYTFALNGNSRSRVNKLYEHAEIRMIGYFILCLRYKLLQEDEFLTRYCIAWLKQDHLGCGDDILTSLSYTPVTLETWNDRSTEHYLHWMEKHYLPASTVGFGDTQTIDQRIANRKLHVMFPLKAENSARLNPSVTFVNESQDAYLTIIDALQNISKAGELQEDSKSLASRVEERLVDFFSNLIAVSHAQLNGCVSYLHRSAMRQNPQFRKGRHSKSFR
ncbi:LADA_0D09736g1_1 [Lachancea dasiensis]|uniref:LADA_0D09736g1_1 n=1 Tax=Lachancea dasiensis TaxID=1072105 RepID=A0A1G4J7C0_9SACH|nr:LADA_0D09736g1_1 [Lachancea dasiensis]